MISSLILAKGLIRACDNMKCSRCQFMADDENYFFPIKVSGKEYVLCSACWGELFSLIELKRDKKLKEEIEGGYFE